MNGKNIKQKLLAGVLVGGIVMSMGIAAYADDTTSQDKGQTLKTEWKSKRGFDRRRKEDLGFRDARSNIGVKSILDSLVEEKLLTQEEADQFLAKQKEKIAEQQKVLEAKREEQLNNSLADLVEKGTITSDQVKKIKTFFETVKQKREEEQEKIKNMTQEERKAYLEENKTGHKDIATQLVDEGILTEDQVKEISGLFPGFPGKHHPNFKIQAPEESTEE